MSARGVGRAPPRIREGLPIPASSGNTRGVIRLRPQTWRQLASLRRQIVDSEGKPVGLESFDRLVQRLMEERTPSPARPPVDHSHGGR